MSGENVIEFLGCGEVFESYGTEVQLKEIMETGNSDIETVAYMGQFLLGKSMDQNERIKSLRNNLSERNQELKHLKERQTHLNVIEETYQAATHEKELELENLKRANCEYQQELKRLQRDVVRSNETETSQRKSVFELTRCRKGWTFQPETFKYFPIRDYCLLCLNPQDHSNDHKKETEDLLRRLTLARNVCIRLEQDLQNENHQKEMLTEKLVALRKEADALTQYLQWSGRVEVKDLKSDDPGKTSGVPPLLGISERCDGSADHGTVQKMREGQRSQQQHNNDPGKTSGVPPMLEISDECDGKAVHGTVQKMQGDQHSQQQHDSQQTSEAEKKVEPECAMEKQVPVTLKEEVEHKTKGQNRDDPNMHCGLSTVDGMCKVCKTVHPKKTSCIKQLFKAMVDFFRSLLKKE